jgi:hypothetical protein
MTSIKKKNAINDKKIKKKIFLLYHNRRRSAAEQRDRISSARIQDCLL